MILNSFYFGTGAGGLERTDFEHFLLLAQGGFLERTDFEQFLLSGQCGGRCGGVVVLKELILNSFYFVTGVVVLKELILNSFYF